MERNRGISPEEERIYKEIIENLKNIYQLKRDDNKYIKRFDREYANMFEYENNLYDYLDEFAGNIDNYDYSYYKRLNKDLDRYMKVYEKSLKNTLSLFMKIINKRRKIKKHIEKTIKLMKELEKYRGP